MNNNLFVPGRSPSPQRVPITHAEPVLGADGQLYELRFEGEADVIRGPLGRFLDLADEIEREGLKVPPEIRDVLDKLSEQ